MLSCTIKCEESWAVRLKSYVILNNNNDNSNSDSNNKDSINVNNDIIIIDRDNKKNVFKYDGVFCNIDDDDNNNNNNNNSKMNICKSIQCPIVNLINLGFNSTILINENVSMLSKIKNKDKDNIILTTLKPILNDLYTKVVNSNIDTNIDSDDIQILNRNISLSCYELYNDIAYDLLDFSSSLKLRTQVLKGSYETHVDGLTQQNCPDITNINNEIEKCIQLRLHLISTSDNDNIIFLSPISHFFISINIDQTTYSKVDNMIRRRFSTLSVVSLAPAEGLSYRVINNINNNINNTNSMNRETINITRLSEILSGNYNTLSFLLSSKKDESLVDKQARLIQGLQNGLQSLSTLQRVVKILNENVTQDYTPKESDNQILKDIKSNINNSSNNNKHIPYRDSILTRILQSSLQGNCVLYLLSIINRYSPSAVSSLRFAFHLYNLYTRVKANDQLLGIINQKKSDMVTMDDFCIDSTTVDTDNNNSNNDSKSDKEFDIENVKFKATLKDFSTDLNALSEDLLRLEADREIYLSKTMGMSLASRREIVPIIKPEAKIVSNVQNTSTSEGDSEEVVFLSLGHCDSNQFNNLDSSKLVSAVSSESSTSVDSTSHRSSISTMSRSKKNGSVSLSSSDDSLKSPLAKVSIRTDSRKATTLQASSLKKSSSEKSSSLASLSPRTQILSSPSSVASSLSPLLSSSSSSSKVLKEKSGSLSSLVPVTKLPSSTSLPAVSSRKRSSTSSSFNKFRDSKNIESNSSSSTNISSSALKRSAAPTTTANKETGSNSDSCSPFMKMISLLPVRVTDNKNINDFNTVDDTVDINCDSDVEYSNTNTSTNNNTNTTSTTTSTLSRERIQSINCESGYVTKTNYQSACQEGSVIAKNTRLFADIDDENKMDISNDSISSIQSNENICDSADKNYSFDKISRNDSSKKIKIVCKKPREIYYMSNRRSLIEEDDDGDELSKDEKMFLRYVSSNQTNSAEKMLIAGIDVHCKNNFERDAIQIASRNGCNEMIEMLLRYNANVSSRGLKGDTLFHLAASNGFVDTMRLLHKCGILPEAVDINGQTCLHIAARRGEIKVLEYLHDDLGFTYDDFLQENFDGQNCYDVIPRRGYNQEELDHCREYVNLIFQEDPKYKDHHISSSSSSSSSSSLKLPIIRNYDKVNVSKFTLKDLEKRYLVQL